ncbi:EamA family transporter [Candidatus Saccharibacteria bacterium]|nr:EamA family transporter [Candidatus Saccharibacteria bacterium]
MAILLAYIFYFVASTSSKLQRRQLATTRETDVGQIDFAFRVTLIIFVLTPLLILFNRPVFNQPIGTLIMLSTVCGAFGAIALSTQYVAQRHVEAGLTSLIGNIYAPTTIVLATILLNEGLKARQVIGAILLISSVVLVSRKHRLSRWRFDRYFWLNVIAGVALSFGLTAERALIKYNSLTTGALLSWGSGALFLGLAALASGTKSQHNLKEASLTGSLRFLHQVSWIVLVTVVANLSVVSAVATFSTAVTFFAAAIFLHEREDLKRKIIGSFIAAAGLLLMV